MLLSPQVLMRMTVSQNPVMMHHPLRTCPHWRVMKTTLLAWRRWIKLPATGYKQCRMGQQQGRKR